MIDLIVHKFDRKLSSILFLFVFHCVSGIILFSWPFDVFQTELQGSLLFLWMIFPFLLAESLEFLFIFVVIFLLAPIFEYKLLMTTLSFLALQALFLEKGKTKLYAFPIKLAAIFIALSVIELIFTHTIFSSSILSFSTISIVYSMCCYIDYFLVNLFRLTLKLLNGTSIYNFIDTSLEIDSIYLEIQKTIDENQMNLEIKDHFEFRALIYRINFSIFVSSLSYYLKKSKNSETILQQKRASLVPLIQQLDQMKWHMDSYQKNQSLKKLDELQVKLSQLNEFCDDYHKCYHLLQ